VQACASFKILGHLKLNLFFNLHIKSLSKCRMVVTVFSVLTACGGGADGGGGGGIAGTSILKTGGLDGNYACVGGSYSLLFLTTG
jgi:hypothetical protein